MNILILGATGQTGQQLLSQALSAGHSVTALVRDPSKITHHDDKLKVVTGDATDAGALSGAMASIDVVLSVLGANSPSLMTNATTSIIAAAKTAGLQRIIMLSSFAVRTTQLQGVTKFITGLAMKPVIADKTAAEALLRASGLSWTIVYATVLSNEPLGAGARVVPATEKIGLSHKIARADVAAWMLHEAENSQYINQDVTISR